jgi:hypothetical protein
MGKFDGPEYLPGIDSVIKFLPADAEEVEGWAEEHAQAGWIIEGSTNDRLFSLVFQHKEGDTATLPFTYQWDGIQIVKVYR